MQPSQWTTFRVRISLYVRTHNIFSRSSSKDALIVLPVRSDICSIPAPNAIACQVISQLMAASIKITSAMQLLIVVWAVHTPPILVHHAQVHRSIRTCVVGGTTSAFYCGIIICPSIRELRETFTSLVCTSRAAPWACMFWALTTSQWKTPYWSSTASPSQLQIDRGGSKMLVCPMDCVTGNGNGYFHNAYFLRVVHSVLRGCVFHHSTGHGLKITQQNDTLIENCTVTDNRWQGACIHQGLAAGEHSLIVKSFLRSVPRGVDTGVWVGQESAGNWDLHIINCVIERNHMYGIQLADTIGFEVRGCTIRNNPVVSKAGLGE
eukprot:COSAG06_NODE_6277_length_3002_cov_1.866345_2_plen_321_part_00